MTPITDSIVSASAPKWDPVVVLHIKKQPDGHFICVGVKNRTTDACGYRIKGSDAAETSELLDEMSVVSPQSTTKSLRDLARLSLCRHHQLQARDKVKQWESAINLLSSSIETRMCITNTHIPVPSPPTVDSPSTFDRGDTARFSDRLQPQQSSGKSLIPQTRDELALKEIAFLRKQLDDLTLRMADLETNIGRSVEPAHRRDLSNNVPVH
jgi:hypothetical protein